MTERKFDSATREAARRARRKTDGTMLCDETLHFGLVRALGSSIYVGPARARLGSFEGYRGFMLYKNTELNRHLL